MPVPFEILANHKQSSELHLSAPVLEWNAHTQTAEPMELQIEFYDNLDAAPDDFLALIQTPRPCKLLNPNLQPWQYSLLTNICYVVPIDYDGTEHLAVLWGFYRPPRDTVIKSENSENWRAIAKDDVPLELPVSYLETVENPPPYYELLSPELTRHQIERLVDRFYIVNIEHEGAPRLASLWDFYQARDTGDFVKAQISQPLNISMKEK